MDLRPLRKRTVVLGALVAVLSVVVAGPLLVARSNDFGWRAQIVGAKLMGRLPGIPMADLLRWLRPGSPVYLEPLAETPNPHAAVRNIRTGPPQAESGLRLFGAHCASCHGDDALGKNGPNLVKAVAERSDWGFFATVKYGRPGTAMAAVDIPDAAIWDVHAYLRRRALGNDAPAGSGAAARAPFKPIESIPAFGSTDADWLTYAGNQAGHRHSRLARITRKNAAQLRLAWVAQLQPRGTPMQATPIVANGTMFVSESHEGVVALDARTGVTLWHYQRPLPDGLLLCCGSPNRGVAIAGDTVLVGTLDAQLIALDANTGKARWSTRVADPAEGYSISGAPLVVGDRVVVGVAGETFGVRGLLAAYSIKDGRLLWTFNTVAGPGTPGHETWPGDSWKTGGATTWATGAFDATTRTVYWGIGNPAPAFNSAVRKGDNLYSNCVVALDADTGKLKWHYQFVPNDDHDWDSAQQPVLTAITWKGEPREVILWANRNGFFYAIDRTTGEFLYARPFVEQTWADGMDAKGRPIARADARPTPTGSLVRPVVGGATSWWPPALDRERKLMFVPTVDAASIYYSGEQKFERGKAFLGGSSYHAANQPSWAGLKAIDIGDGSVRWQATLRSGETVTRIVGGVLATATGLVFAGYEDSFYAFDADRGTVLWDVRLGARVGAPPVTYAIGDRQYVVIAAGSTVFAFSLPAE